MPLLAGALQATSTGSGSLQGASTPNPGEMLFRLSGRSLASLGPRSSSLVSYDLAGLGFPGIAARACGSPLGPRNDSTASCSTSGRAVRAAPDGPASGSSGDPGSAPASRHAPAPAPGPSTSGPDAGAGAASSGPDLCAAGHSPPGQGTPGSSGKASLSERHGAHVRQRRGPNPFAL